jgi:glycosyltransferase involved in cell wall biosynthesis
VTGPALSVVIPTRDRPERLDACLGSIEGALADDDELIVVDSASTSGAVREVAARHRTTYLRCDLPGASRARNAGWLRSSGELIAFVDDDVLVGAGWRDAVVEAFMRHPEVAFVTGPIGAEPSRPQQIGPTQISSKQGYFDGLAHSANLVVRRSALSAICGFDEQLGAGAPFRASEDRDLFDRLQAIVGPGCYEPLATVWHEQWRSKHEFLNLNFAYGYGAGARVAKLFRSQFVTGLRAAKDLFGGWGIGCLVRNLAGRRFYLASVDAIRMVGSLFGLTRGLLTPVKDGHFAPRKDSSATG